jgi:hypothetical protein
MGRNAYMATGRIAFGAAWYRARWSRLLAPQGELIDGECEKEPRHLAGFHLELAFVEAGRSSSPSWPAACARRMGRSLEA